MQTAVPTDPVSQRLNQIARRWGDDHFDAAAGLIFFEHPKSVHTTGGGAHLLRESCYYAYTLLRSGTDDDLRRAETILEQVLPKQNLDPASRFWACFTCEHEQDWATWTNPDQNWAQFLGMIFAYILVLDEEHPRLPASLHDRVDAAFRLTVAATLRRDVSAAYTNIALLSAGVAAAGASLRQIEGAEAFSFAKLSQVLARAQGTGTFDEYLSPTYYGTDLYALYSVEKFGGTERLRAAAGRLLELAWDDIEYAYHPPTHQLGGPHSRAYGDNMLAYAAKLKFYLFLATAGRYPLNDVETRHAHDCGILSIIRTHPVRRRIDADAPRPASFRRVALPRVEGEPERAQTQYQDEACSLGSINEQDGWSQRRNLIAYWRAEPGGCVGFAKSAWENLEGDVKAPRFFSTQARACALVGLRIPTASEPNALFSHRLDFGLPAEVEAHPPAADGFLVTLPGMRIEVRPIPLPGVGTPVVTVAPAAGNGAGGLAWQWPRPEPGQPFYWGAFAVSFTPEGAVPAAVTDLFAVEEDGAFALAATVAGERLGLRMPRFA